MINKLIKLARLIPNIAEQLYKIAGVKDEVIKRFPQYEEQINELSNKGVADSFLFSAVNLLDKHNKPLQKSEIEKEKREQEAAEKEGKNYISPERKRYTVEEVFEIIMKKQRGEKSNTLINSVQSQFPEYTQEIDELSKMFPKTYLIWACNQLRNKEPYHEVVSILKTYEKYKSKLEDKELYHYKTLGELRGAIESLSEISDIPQNLKYDVLVDNADISIIVPRNKEASVYFGKNTKWCTAATISENMFMDYSLMNYHLYIITNKKSNPRKEPLAKIQYGIKSENILINDANDNTITDEDVENYYGTDIYNIINGSINKYFFKNPNTDAKIRLDNYIPEDLEQDISEGNKDIVSKYINKMAKLPDETALRTILNYKDKLKELLGHEFINFLSNIKLSNKTSEKFVDALYGNIDIMEMLALVFRNINPINDYYFAKALKIIRNNSEGLEAVVFNNINFYIKKGVISESASHEILNLFKEFLPRMGKMNISIVHNFLKKFISEAPLNAEQIEYFSELKVINYVGNYEPVDVYDLVRYNNNIKEDAIVKIIDSHLRRRINILKEIRLESMSGDQKRNNYILNQEASSEVYSFLSYIFNIIKEKKVYNLAENIIARVKQLFDFCLTLNVELDSNYKQDIISAVKYKLYNELSKKYTSHKLLEKNGPMNKDKLEQIDKEFDQLYSVLTNHKLIGLNDEEREEEEQLYGKTYIPND